MRPLSTILKSKAPLADLAKELRYLTLNRACACDRCPHKRQKQHNGNLFASPINNPTNTFYCRIAGIPLLNLLTDPAKECPAAQPHWTAIPQLA